MLATVTVEEGRNQSSAPITHLKIIIFVFCFSEFRFFLVFVTC